MKIIHTDNFNGDYPNEEFVNELPRLSEDVAKKIVDLINSSQPEYAPRYYVVVSDDYKLEPGFTP